MKATRIVMLVCFALILVMAGYGEGTKEAPGAAKSGGVQYITIGTASVGGGLLSHRYGLREDLER